MMAGRGPVAENKPMAKPAQAAKAKEPKSDPNAMFGQVVNNTYQVGTRKWYTVPLSIVAHVVAIAAVVIVPLMAMDALPTPAIMMAFGTKHPFH